MSAVSPTYGPQHLCGNVGTAFVVTTASHDAAAIPPRAEDATWCLDHAERQRHSAEPVPERMGRYLLQHGGKATSLAQGEALAQGNLYGQFVRQATMLAYLDVIKVLAVAMLCLIPLVF